MPSSKQKYIAEFMVQVNSCVESLAIKCIENSVLDVNEIKSQLLSTVINFRDNIDLDGLSINEKENVLSSLATIENSIVTFVDYGVGGVNSEQKSVIFSLNKNINKTWLKTLIKSVVQVLVVVVCLVGGTFLGAVLGDLVCPNPICLVVGGAAGFYAGAMAASDVNRWVDSW